MRSRTSIQILVKASAEAAGSCARIVAKASRCSKTRYWVVLPGGGGRRERWLLVPSPEVAIRHVGRWLLTQATRCFGEDPQQAPTANRAATRTSQETQPGEKLPKLQAPSHDEGTAQLNPIPP